MMASGLTCRIHFYWFSFHLPFNGYFSSNILRRREQRLFGKEQNAKHDHQQENLHDIMSESIFFKYFSKINAR